MSYLRDLRLSDFRNYGVASMEDLSAGFIVLSGPNGAGKTNILEAVSLLTPGRGIRGAKLSEAQKQDSENPWTVFTNAVTDFGDIKIGTAYEQTSEKRKINIQGETVKSQAALSEYLAALWLTPQMDGLFREGTSERRRFLDRLILTHDPAHAGRVRRYENAMYQRSRLLKDDGEKADTAWLDGLESQMAETGIAIAASRIDYMDRLTYAIEKNTLDTKHIFPQADISLLGLIENQLNKQPALSIENNFKNMLKNSRSLDAVSGGASVGPHRTDLHVVYKDKGMPASQCSTGEQKALLIGLVLAHCWLIAQERTAPPLLLLDEVAAHLDENRRNALYTLLEKLGGQVWLTGTDENLFDSLKGKADFFVVKNGGITRKAQ